MPGGQGFLAGVHLGDVPHQAMLQRGIPEVLRGAVGVGPGGVRTAFSFLPSAFRQRGVAKSSLRVGIAFL